MEIFEDVGSRSRSRRRISLTWGVSDKGGDKTLVGILDVDDHLHDFDFFFFFSGNEMIFFFWVCVSVSGKFGKPFFDKIFLLSPFCFFFFLFFF